jgi:hypothetical protein
MRTRALLIVVAASAAVAACAAPPPAPVRATGGPGTTAASTTVPATTTTVSLPTATAPPVDPLRFRLSDSLMKSHGYLPDDGGPAEPASGTYRYYEPIVGGCGTVISGSAYFASAGYAIWENLPRHLNVSELFMANVSRHGQVLLDEADHLANCSTDTLAYDESHDWRVDVTREQVAPLPGVDGQVAFCGHLTDPSGGRKTQELCTVVLVHDRQEAFVRVYSYQHALALSTADTFARAIAPLIAAT